MLKSMLQNQFHKAKSAKKMEILKRFMKSEKPLLENYFVQNIVFNVNIILFAHFSERNERIKKLVIRVCLPTSV